MLPLLTPLLSGLGATEMATALGSPDSMFGNLLKGDANGTKSAQAAAAAAGGDASPMIAGPPPQNQLQGVDIQKLMQLLQQSGQLGTGQ